MLFHLVRIRTLQLFRVLKGLGLYVILITGAFIFSVYACYLHYQISPDCFIITAALFLISFILHSTRNDISFVYLHLAKPYLEIYAEYAVLVFPFAFPALLTSNWYCFVMIYVALLVLPLYRPLSKQQTRIKKLPGIQAVDFEWISGTKRVYVILLIFYTAALLFSWFKIVPLFLLWVMVTIISSFYEESESLQILRANPLPVSQLLRQKLFRHIRYIVVLFIPVLIINTVFNPGYWLLNLLFVATQISLLSFFIVFKYAMYEPGRDLKTNSIITGITSVGSLLPFFLPVPFLMFILYYFKARKNLQIYLHD